jgi:predicted alpha/beta-fold hydrolase
MSSSCRPLLWINAANDPFFEPKLVERMVAAYNRTGGHATHDAADRSAR